jgi:molybdate transport system substrate-binding protein
LILVDDALEELGKDGRIAAGSRTDLARSEMGLAVRKGLPKPDIKTVDAFRRAMLDAKSVAISTSASGVYLANELFPQLGITGEMKAKTRVVGVTGVVVAKGEADIAIQQISELLPVAGIDYVGPLPREIQKVTMFVAVIAAGAREVGAAKTLIAFLASPAAAPAIAKSALEPVTSR